MNERTIRLADAQDLVLEYARNLAIAIPEDQLSDLSRQVFGLLQTLTAEPKGENSSTRHLAGHTHIRIREVMWELTLTSLALLPALVVPGPGTVAASCTALLTFLLALTRKITSLSDVQLEICRAVVVLKSHKKQSGKLLVNEYPTLKEIDSELRSRNIVLPNLAIALDDLVPQVLTRIYLDEQEPYYDLPA